MGRITHIKLNSSEQKMPQYTPYTNRTMQMYDKMNTILYFCGLTDFWIADVKLPAGFVKVYNVVAVFVEILMFSFLAMEIGALITQNHLSSEQTDDLQLFTVAHSVLHSYVLVLMWHKQRVRAVLRQLALTLKQVHNDVRLDGPMHRQVTFYIILYVLSTGFAIVLYGANAISQYIKSRAPLTTVITAWPDVEDDSDIAQIARIVLFFIWIVYFYRISGSFYLIVTILICLRFQYKNLQNYFETIEGIFDKSREHSELEREYEAALKVGIKLHQDTLWCVQECHQIYSYVFSAQVVLSLSELVAILSQMMTLERTLVNMANCLTMACSVMIMAGFVFWTAGDVTVEATYLPAAMYGSGWQHCCGPSSARVRRLLALAMIQAQKPVEFMALGCVIMSYETYLAICKSSYSVFSVMY